MFGGSVMSKAECFGAGMAGAGAEWSCVTAARIRGDVFVTGHKSQITEVSVTCALVINVRKLDVCTLQ